MWFCMCPSNDTCDKNKKDLEVGTGAQQERQDISSGYSKHK